jgi:2-keto-4-pentenoate hydratase/2-oxohepta-3-ene-1,7-dioic acid hydratase in catechol pathway
MKLVTIDCREIGGRPGVILSDDDILDLAAAPSTLDESQWIPYSVVSVLAAGQEGFDRAALLVNSLQRKSTEERDALRRDGVLLPYATTALLPPVRRPGLVLVVDQASRAYIKSPNTAVGNETRVELLWNDDAPVECAAMLAAVFGRPLYRANSSEAAASIAGFTLVADLSAPPTDDFQQYVESQQFPGANPMGPAIVTTDELGDPRDADMTLSMNDVVVGADSAYDFAEDAARRIATLSQRYAFRPGDMVCFEPRTTSELRGHRLHAGDRVNVSLRNCMSLEFTVAKD